MYDIFISYRHRLTADKAEHLLTLLENNGYRGRVSFDKDNLNQRFDLELIHRIDYCTDFIIVLSEDSFSKLIDCDTEKYQELAQCPYEDFVTRQNELLPNPDFTRLELARALAQGKNIIPIAPIKNERYNFDALKLPSDIQDIIKFHAIFYDTNSSLTFQDVIKIKLLGNSDRPSLLQSKPSRHCIRMKVLGWSIAAVAVLLSVFFMRMYQSDSSSCEKIDLGLSVYWADRNVGAISAEESGDYFAWGETKTKDAFSEKYYKWFNPVDSSYSFLGDDISGTRYDVARMKLGEKWRMPTEAELDELFNRCDVQLKEKNGVRGYELIGPNGNCIFLPAAGYRLGTSVYNPKKEANYWLGISSSKEGYAKIIGIEYKEAEGKPRIVWGRLGLKRYIGLPVRPVMDK